MIKNTAFTFLLFFILINPSFASAWLQDSGKGLVIANTSYYSASKYFDNSGDKKSQNKYRKYELNPYLEYGFSEKLTVGANIFLSRTSQFDTAIGQNRRNYGIGDSEFFTRLQIYKNNGLVFSAEPMIKLPSPDSRSDQPLIGSKNFDAGLGFSGGYGFKSFGLNHFVNIDAGYRHRFGDAHDQIKLAATAGVSATEDVMFSGQIFTTIRVADAFAPAFTQSSGDDYDLTKLQISAIYKMDRDLSFQLGGFSHVDGKNTGGGSGTIFSIYKAF